MYYTNTLKLSKPSYSDDIDVEVLNTNSDIIDSQIENIKNINTTQDSRLSALENKTYPYLPLEGGTVTGDLNVNGNTNINGSLMVDGKLPQYELERRICDSNEKYTITSIKYSNGVLEQVVRYKQFSDTNDQVAFLIPFIDTNDISLAACTYSLATDSYTEPYNDWIWSIANLSTTGAKFKSKGDYARPCYTVRGYWK